MSPQLWIAVALLVAACIAVVVTYVATDRQFTRQREEQERAGAVALRHAQELEARVEARTVELSLANRALSFTQFAMDNAADAVLWVNRQTRLVYVNNAACRLLGYDRGDLIGTSCGMLNENLASEERRHRLHAKDGAAKFESVLRRCDGTLVPVEITANHLVFDGGEHTCLFARDITERRRAEGARMAQLQAARTLSTISSRFVSGENLDAAVGEALADIHTLLGACCSAYFCAEGTPVTFRLHTSCGDSEHCHSWQDELVGSLLGALRGGEIQVIREENSPANTMVLLPLCEEEAITGVMVFANAGKVELWREGDFPQLRVAARVITSGIQRNRAEVQRQTLLEENQLLARQSLEIQERERANLARELHDEMGQCLTAIRADAQSICRLSQEREPRIFASGKAIGEVASHVYQVVRDIVHRLRPDILDDLGLGEALRDVVKQWHTRHPEMEWVLTMPEPLGYVPEAVQITVYRVVQESITNIIKHAGASRVEVTALRSRDGLEVSVRDNGHGRNSSGKKGLGMLGMRERVLSAGGSFKVSNQIGQGYLIQVFFPLDAEENEYAS